MEGKMAGVNNGKTYLEDNVKPVARSNTFSINPTDFEECSICNGNHYVAKARLVTTTDKVSYSNQSNINLYSDLNNYINCPICIKPDATNTDNGPGTNSQ